MKVKTKKENICLYKCSLNYNVNKTIEQDVLVPDVKPDIIKIINIEPKIFISKINTAKDKVNIEGKIIYYIMYKSADNSNKHRTIVSINPLKADLNIQNEDLALKFKVVPKIKNIISTLPNERKINIKTDVEFNICGYKSDNMALVIGFEDSARMEVKKKKEIFNNVIACKDVNINSREEIVISEQRPDIYEIVSLNSKIENVDYKQSYNKIIIKADLIGNIAYTSEKDGNTLQNERFSIPFTGFLEVDNLPDAPNVEMAFYMENLEATLNTNSTRSNSLLIDLDILARVIVSNKKEVEYIEDMYFLEEKNESDCTYADIKIQNDLQRKEINIVESVDNFFKADESILMYNIENESINNKLVDGVASVEGSVRISCLLGNLDEIESRKIDLTISKEIATDVKENIDAKFKIEDLNITREDKNLNVNFKIKSEYRTYEDRMVIADDEIIAVPILLNEFNSIVVYNIKKGDTLWDIAKKYKTTVENIVKINNIQNSNKIDVNEKILIIR
ncbi:MAG: DUF3794 domain-containing protein [Clostridia bacterium]